MSLEHFISGAATGGPRAYVHLLGHKAALRDGRTQPFAQVERLYRAEQAYGREAVPHSHKFISPASARDFVGEAIFHPAMDEIHGIKELRSTFNPEHVTFPNIIGEGVGGRLAIGRVSSDGTMKLQTMSEQFLKYFNEKNPGKLGELIKANPEMDFRQMMNKVRLSTVTHETSHLLLNNLSNDLRRELNGLKVGHEWPMARTHVHIVRRLLGPQYGEALKSHYEKLGVDFGNKSI